MKHNVFSVIIRFLCLVSVFSQCQRTENETGSFPSRWIFTERNTHLYAENWTGEEHHIGSMSGTSARIEAVRSHSDQPFTYSDRYGTPYVGTLVEDDYIMFTVPSADIRKGSYIEIDAAIVSNPSSPKYFIVEYLEDGKWKPVERSLKKVPENPELEYSFMCTGLGSGENHEYTCVYQTIPFSKGLKDEDLQIRFRAVGKFTCSGVPQDPTSKDGEIGFVSYGFTGAYIQNLGTSVPVDTTNILCIGNSFTFFSDAPSMLKEIAWSQGRYFDIKASLKGGQTLGQHTGRILTNKLAEEGGYDYAIFQDQSQTPARYASDPKKYSNVPEDYMRLSDMITEYSPECKIIMEQTWAYPSQRFGGFGDFASFTRLLEEGAGMMAAQNGGDVSPIGRAFEIVYNENKDIRLYDTDNKHQSHYGTYLKACVNYLTITGEAFVGNAADCGIEPEKASYLRTVAERVALSL